MNVILVVQRTFTYHENPIGKSRITSVLSSKSPSRYDVLSCVTRPIRGSLRTGVFEAHTATGSELYSLLTCPQLTTYTLLCILSPLEIRSIKSGRQDGPGTRNVLLQLPSSSQKRACLSSLAMVSTRRRAAYFGAITQTEHPLFPPNEKS